MTGNVGCAEETVLPTHSTGTISHIFGGPFRDKSERYDLVVYLCHNSCHIFGEYAAHRNPDTMDALHKYGQELAMAENGWTVQQFITEFGRNYL